MTLLPDYRPQKLSLGPLETEVLHIIWSLGSASVTEVHQRLLINRAQNLTSASVTTVLRRLTEKGWLVRKKTERIFTWHPLISHSQAQALNAYEHLLRFLSVGQPDTVAAFADSLDEESCEQLIEISLCLHAWRQTR